MQKRRGTAASDATPSLLKPEILRRVHVDNTRFRSGRFCARRRTGGWRLLLSVLPFTIYPLFADANWLGPFRGTASTPDLAISYHGLSGESLLGIPVFASGLLGRMSGSIIPNVLTRQADVPQDVVWGGDGWPGYA